jgi:ABC-2 type transport system permease protein
MLPVALVQVLPMLLLGTVMAEPGGSFARLLSIFPPTAPLTMLLRLGYEPAPQLVDLALSLALLAATALASVWAAGRVLRVGLLVQGRSATLREIARWVRAG